VWQNGQAQDFASVPASTSGERGLLGLAIQSRHVYAFYSRADIPTLQRVVRWPDCKGQAGAEEVIVDNIPAGADCCHKGGRIAFSPDGYLYVTVGDNHVAQDAQDPCSWRGKILRFTVTGTPAGACNGVWIRGLRNPFGIAFAPDGIMAITNNGPSSDAGTPCGGCGDMFDLVGKGGVASYQWPYCWGYSHPDTSYGVPGCNGLPEAQYSTEGGPYQRSTPYFTAPTGIAWVASGAFANHFVFCTYTPQHLEVYNGPRNVTDSGIPGCELDVKQGPDGALYYSDEGTIYRH
jgi:glucose/arabinose dehydrogenase